MDLRVFTEPQQGASHSDRRDVRLRRSELSTTQRFYLQVLDLADLDHIALLGDEVRPHLLAA